MSRGVGADGAVVVRQRKPPKFADTGKLVEVLRLVALGYTTEMIGREIHLSENGVKSRMRALLDYLGAADRAHAVHIGHTRGILGDAAIRLAKLKDGPHTDDCALFRDPQCTCQGAS